MTQSKLCTHFLAGARSWKVQLDGDTEYIIDSAGKVTGSLSSEREMGIRANKGIQNSQNDVKAKRTCAIQFSCLPWGPKRTGGAD